MRRPSATAALLSLLALACAPARRPPAVPQPPDEAAGPALPPIPFRDRPLVLDLVYPAEGGRITVRDSTFVYGSTGTGRARLTINGTAVPVQPNGAFLAFLPVPADGLYHLRATAGAETAQLDRHIEAPDPPPSLAPGSAVILEATVFPQGAWTALPGERIDVGFRGTAGGSARLLLPDGTRVPLVEQPAEREAPEGVRNFGGDPAALRTEDVDAASDYRGYFIARPLVAADSRVPTPRLAGSGQPRAAAGGRPGAVGIEPTGTTAEPAGGRTNGAGPGLAGGPAPDLAGERVDATVSGPAVLELIIGADTARTPLPLNLGLLDAERPPVGVALAPEPTPDRAGRVVASAGRVRASPGPGFVYHYFWPNGTRLMLTGERSGQFRVRLAPSIDAWVPAPDVRLLPAGTPPPASAVGTVRFTHYADAVDVRLQLDQRLPFHVHEDERSIRITLYGGTSNTSWLQYGRLDPLIELAEWSQPAEGVYTLTVHLTQELWGYRTFWTEGDDLVLRIRRPPPIDAERPLEGLLIAVDAGHPPGGAMGPTRYTEAQANLAIARQLRTLLERAGARVLMTRTDMDPLGLYERTQMAIGADADLFVSVHNNAFPDGVNPFENNHTIVYYFYVHSADLARALQRELSSELGLRDHGIGRASLAVVRRNSWMPAALTESMFLMLPRQEAALRDPEVQQRIAAACVRGIEAFLRARARETR